MSRRTARKHWLLHHLPVMGSKYLLGTIRTTIVRALKFLLTPILWSAKKIRERRDWRKPKGLDLEMNEILRAQRFEEANPRADEYQATELRQTWYKVRKQQSTWTFVPGGMKAERGEEGNDARRPLMVRQHAWQGVPFVTLPLDCTPVPERIGLRLKTLPRLDTDPPLTKSARPRSEIEAHDRCAATFPVSARDADSVLAQAPKKIKPVAPTLFSWDDEWPRPQTSSVRTVYFRSMAEEVERLQGPPSPQNESWYEVDLN